MSIERMISLFPIPLTESPLASSYLTYRCDTPVVIPLSEWETAGFYRWQMREWCQEFCEAEWSLLWTIGGVAAVFHYASHVDAVKFKLRFSELLEQ